jgi:hypothetical protein
MVDTSGIKRRIAELEKQSGLMARLVAAVLRRVHPRKVNAKSSTMTKDESAAFRRQMVAHGVTDDDDTRTPSTRRRDGI